MKCSIKAKHFRHSLGPFRFFAAIHFWRIAAAAGSLLHPFISTHFYETPMAVILPLFLLFAKTDWMNIRRGGGRKLYGAFFCCPTNSPFLLLRVVCFVLLLTCPHKVFLRLQELRLAICEPCSSECLCSFGSRSFIAGLGRLAKGPTRSNHAQFFQSVGTVCKVHCCFSPIFSKTSNSLKSGQWKPRAWRFYAAFWWLFLAVLCSCYAANFCFICFSLFPAHIAKFRAKQWMGDNFVRNENEITL